MRHSRLVLLFTLCIFTFQQTHALRRIKRGSNATQNKTKLSNDILLDMHNISNDVKMGERAANSTGETRTPNEHNEGAWAKKAVAAVEHAIDKAFATLSHKSDEEKLKKHAPLITPLPLHYTTNNVPLNGAESNFPVAVKDLHKPSWYMLENGNNAERYFGNMPHDVEFGAGDGPAEVLIIDNGMPPVMGMQHALNSFAFHQPNLRNLANSFKRLAELSKESKLNNVNTVKMHTEHNNNNNLKLVDKQSADNGISGSNVNKEYSMLNELNERNDNHNNSTTVGSHNRNNDHITTSSENNSKTTYNRNNNNNDALIDGKSQHNSCMQQQQSEVKQSFPALLSFAHQALANIGESGALQEHTQAQQHQPQQQQQRMQHDKQAENADENGQSDLHAQTNIQPDTRQQYAQFVKHTNGKMLPMESFLKFANMMLFKVGPDGTPLRAQGTQLAMNGNPTASVISISPSKDGTEDTQTIDYIYKSLEDPQFHFLRNPATPPLPLSTTLTRPFVLPPYSVSGPAPPFNLIENALDMFLGADADDGNEEMEIFCPIHHPKKKSSESLAEGKDKDGVIQVCSCRIYKKNKNA